MKLRQGRLEADFDGTHLEIFTDPVQPTLRVTTRSVKPMTLRVAYEGWRNEQLLPKEQVADAMVWYHRNEDSVVLPILKNQSLDQLPGTYDPIINRTFGAWIDGPGLKRSENNQLVGEAPKTSWDLRISCPMVVADKAETWVNKARGIAKSATDPASVRTQSETWWRNFWSRSWILVKGDTTKSTPLPANAHPLLLGIDSNGGSRFPGSFGRVGVYNHALNANELKTLAATGPDTVATLTDDLVVKRLTPIIGDTLGDNSSLDFSRGMTLEAWIKLNEVQSARIFDKLTAGVQNGFLLDTHPGDGLRLIIGSEGNSFPKVLKSGIWHHVAVTYDTADASIALLLDGKELLRTGKGSRVNDPVTCGYNRQRYVTACQGRGEFPIKFNGGAFTVEPKFTDPKLSKENADWRRWGECFWFQNTRHMYHPLLVSGDHDLMAPFFAFYDRARPLAEARAKSWYQADGANFPETMTIFGSHHNPDYGNPANRKGRKIGEPQNPYIRKMLNPGLELTAMMLDYWDWTGDERFLNEQLLPMAVSVLRHFDSRFKKDERGLLIIDDTQVVETYWEDVVNDLPCVAGIRSITARLMALPTKSTSAEQSTFFTHMAKACPPIPTEERTVGGKKVRSLAPAEKYNPKKSNCEHAELYAVWPFRLYGPGKPDLELARAAYATRGNQLDLGWGYDGNVAACLGMTDEAVRIMLLKCNNSHPAYRFPASWGPNFDWIPDQNHGGNLMNTVQLMLMQCEGRHIQLLPAWPSDWDVNFKLHAPMKTTVECEFRKGKIVKLMVQPETRRKDIIIPDWIKN